MILKNNDNKIKFISLGNVGLKLPNHILISNYELYIYYLDRKKNEIKF